MKKNINKRDEKPHNITLIYKYIVNTFFYTALK